MRNKKNAQKTQNANDKKTTIGTNLPKGRLLYYYSQSEMERFENRIKEMKNENVCTVENDGSSNCDKQQQQTQQQQQTNDKREDDWCGWHNDHSALTGLALGNLHAFFFLYHQTHTHAHCIKATKQTYKINQKCVLFAKTKNKCKANTTKQTQSNTEKQPF